MFGKLAAAVVLLAISVRFASAIHCYSCTSVNNSMCLDPTLYDAETLAKFLPVNPCSHGVYTAEPHGFFCRKIVQTIFHKGYEPEVRVTRGCGWMKHHKNCYKADNEDHLETACQCFTDGCNGATGVTPAWLLLAATGLAAFGKAKM